MLKGVSCVRGRVDMYEHLRCMVEEPGPPCGLEPSILQIITRPAIERMQEDVTFSPSSLSACHRQDALKTEKDWYLDVRQGWKMTRGTIIHEGMGHEPAYPGVLGVVREKRMAAQINTKYGTHTFKGKPDLVVLNSIEKLTGPVEYLDENGKLRLSGASETKTVLKIKIVDYKTKSEVGHDLVMADDRYVYQVNEYGWLAAQYLPHWLNLYQLPSDPEYPGSNDYREHLFLNDGVSLPHIDSVVVEELSIVYMDMKQTRTFTSRSTLEARGKMLSDKIDGRWVRRKPAEYETLDLMPIHLFRPKYTESLIRQGIETQIESRTSLAGPLTGDDASLMCRSCPVRQACYVIGKKEGYEMADQLPFIDTLVEPK